jgi:RecB family exonuclease
MSFLTMSNQINNIEKSKSVSFTQFSIWSECPYRWYLTYVKNIKSKKQSIHTLFGTVVHEVLQNYLKTMYASTIDKAGEMDLPKMLLEGMKSKFAEYTQDGYEMDMTKDQMVEFFEDGVEILDWFTRYRHDYFSKRGYELVGVEVQLDYPISNGIKFKAYLDIIIRDTVLNKYKIFDIKTSTMGWNKYQKKDKKKLVQLVLYKTFYALQYNVNPNDIDVEFLVVKRKLYENVEFPQKRFQTIKPASGTLTQKETLRQLKMFVNSCFDERGEYKVNAEFPKYPSPKTCKYCDFCRTYDENDIIYCDRAGKKFKL